MSGPNGPEHSDDLDRVLVEVARDAIKRFNPRIDRNVAAQILPHWHAYVQLSDDQVTRVLAHFPERGGS